MNTYATRTVIDVVHDVMTGEYINTCLISGFAGMGFFRYPAVWALSLRMMGFLCGNHVTIDKDWGNGSHLRGMLNWKRILGEGGALLCMGYSWSVEINRPERSPVL